MAVNKVSVNGKTVLDLSADTVTAATLNKGVTAHNAAGQKITGTRVDSATWHKGSSAPAASLGNNGDLYLQNIEGLV